MNTILRKSILGVILNHPEFLLQNQKQIKKNKFLRIFCCNNHRLWSTSVHKERKV